MIKKLLGDTKGYKDPIQYHPEQSLYQHIALVVARAYLIGDRSLIAAALLHDLCKPTHGRDHAKEMGNLISDCDDVRYYIHSMGGNTHHVQRLVKHHMDKQVTSKNKDVPFMDTFFAIDDMVCRHDQVKVRVKDFILPCGSKRSGTITFVGISPIQAMYSNGDFTLTMDRTPFTYPLHMCDWVLKSIV